VIEAFYFERLDPLLGTSLRISAEVRGRPTRFFDFLCLGLRSHFWNVLCCTIEMRCRKSSPTVLPNRLSLRLSFGVRGTRLGSFDRRIWFSIVRYWIWAISWSWSDRAKA